MIKAIILGFNGVIYNSTPYIQKARDFYLKQFGVVRTKDDIAKHLGRAMRDQIKDYNERYNLNLDFETFSSETRKLSKSLMKGDNIQPNSGVRRLMEDAKNNNIKLGIASFMPKSMLIEDLEMLKLDISLFDAITALEDITTYRPNPEFLFIESKKLKLKPEECIFISDDNEGLHIAKKIGMKTIGLINDLQSKDMFKDADLVISSIAELNFNKIKNLLSSS